MRYMLNGFLLVIPLLVFDAAFAAACRRRTRLLVFRRM